MIVKQSVVVFLAAAAVFSSLDPLSIVASQPAIAGPDFTKGDEIPEGASHDWTLGATGARGWMYCDKLVTTDARQVYITKVETDSPADGILTVGDVILGVGSQPFSHDPRTELGKALTIAESEAGQGRFSLIRWRDGKTETVILHLPILGTYSATAPFDCPKSRRVFELGCEALALRMGDPSYKSNPITRSLNAMALLASGESKYVPLVEKEAHWAAEFSASSFKTWWYGYVMMFLSEYVIATGDDSVMPGLRRLTMAAAKGQSIVGSWGHTFANSSGRVGGYGMMNSPGIPLTISLILARKAGVDDPIVSEAIEKSARLLRFYVGKGAIPYGDHHPWIQTHEDNGKCGMAAIMFELLKEPDAANYFSQMSIASHSGERDGGHTGNFFNILWALPSTALSGPNATGAWMGEFGGRYFDLARRWDGAFVHQGPPEMRNDRYANWDCTGAYLLAYAIPLRKLHVTGKHQSCISPIDASAAANLIADGRGWSNKDRNGTYDQMSVEELLSRLSSWSPVVRERAAMALGRRKVDINGFLIERLDAPELYTQYGACQALKIQGRRGAEAVPALLDAFGSNDLWLRILAADALAAIGTPAQAAVPELLARLTQHDNENDPRNMEQRYLCFALFNKRGGLIGKSLEGVDHDLLLKAVRAGLRNQDGRARGSLSTVYENLTYDEIKPLLPAIHHAIIEPAPSGIMFANGIRLSGVELLAKHRIQEGIPLCIQIMEIDKWGKQDRIRQCLNAVEVYGPAAKLVIPELRQLEKELLAHREARNLRPLIEQTRTLIQKIEKSDVAVQLRSINDR